MNEITQAAACSCSSSREEAEGGLESVSGCDPSCKCGDDCPCTDCRCTDCGCS